MTKTDQCDVGDVLRLWEEVWGDTEDCSPLQAATWLEYHALEDVLEAIRIVLIKYLDGDPSNIDVIHGVNRKTATTSEGIRRTGFSHLQHSAQCGMESGRNRSALTIRPKGTRPMTYAKAIHGSSRKGVRVRTGLSAKAHREAGSSIPAAHDGGRSENPALE